jgi:pilus assembly protein CpaB
MRLLKKRSSIGIISIALAFVLVFVVAPMINASENQDVQIIRVTKNIPEGTAITKDMVETVKVGGHNLPANVLKDEKEVVGKFTAAALQPGDYILSTKTSDKSQSAYLTDLDGSRQAVSISIKSFAAGLSGKLESGDIISLVVTGYGDSKQTFAPGELRYIKLLAATTDKGTDTDQTKNTEDKGSSDDNDNIPSTLTLLVTPEQRTMLVDYENNGKLYASFVYRGSAQEAKKFLDMEDEYLIANKNKVNGAQEQNPSGGSGGAVANGQ